MYKTMLFILFYIVFVDFNFSFIYNRYVAHIKIVWCKILIKTDVDYERQSHNVT